MYVVYSVHALLQITYQLLKKMTLNVRLNDGLTGVSKWRTTPVVIN